MIAVQVLDILARMRRRIGWLWVVLLAGGAGIVGSGCGSAIHVPRDDAGVPPDAAISSGGVAGTGGMHGSGGVTGAGGTGTVASGGMATGGSTLAGTGGGGGVALGGSLGGGGTAPTGGSSAVGGSGGSPGGVLLVATYDGQVHATWQNQTSQSIFLGGCGTVEWSRLEGSDWVNHGAFIICAWEGIAVEVAAGATYTESQSFARAEAARYRLSGRYGVGCTPGLGLSSAGCTAFFTATSNEFVVPATGGSGGAGAGGVIGSGGAGVGGTAAGGAGGTVIGGAGGSAAGGSFSDGGSSDGAGGCTDVCALYGEACCVWSDPCLVPTSSCTFDVLAASVGTTYEYADLETKVAALPQDISMSFTDQDIAWAAADPWPAGRIELHLTENAASRYGTILDGARDGRVFRVSCGGQSLFVGVFYLVYGAAALDTPVLHEARENGVLILRLGAYQSAWVGMGVDQPATSPLRERIDRSELRAALCRRGVLHVLDPNARPANP
jgi:hypothetical protein